MVWTWVSTTIPAWKRVSPVRVCSDIKESPASVTASFDTTLANEQTSGARHCLPLIFHGADGCRWPTWWPVYGDGFLGSGGDRGPAVGRGRRGFHGPRGLLPCSLERVLAVRVGGGRAWTEGRARE